MIETDAIVVGAGPNGLAAGLRLAEAGWSVTVLEANDQVGGAARTLECTLPGFRHDLGAAFFPLVPLSPAIGGRDLARHGLEFLHAPISAAHPFPGGRAIALGRTTAETAASIDGLAPGDGARWTEIDEEIGSLVGLFLHSQMVRWPAADMAQIIARGRIGGVLNLARTTVAAATAVAERMRSPEARAFFTAPSMHADLQPEMPGMAIYALILGLLGQRNGMPVVAGGTGNLTLALAAALAAAGGQVRTGSRVSRIVVEGGRAAGVEVEGTPIRARRAVLAALDTHLAIELTGREAFPAGALRQVDRFRRGLGTFKVDWALDGQVPWDAADCRRAGVVHLADTVAEMSRSAWEAGHGLLPSAPTLVLGQQSLADPGRAPAGRHTLWGYARVPTVLQGDRAADASPAASWEQVREAFLQRMELRIEEHAPGFRERVLARRTWTPADLEAADASLVGGDISNGSFAADQQLLFRPGPSWWRWGTPVRGLYLAGAGTPPGGGVHGACGDLAAAQALADDRRMRRLVVGGTAALAAVAALRSARR